MIYPTKKLVCEFLHIFSRFEYALKKTNFLKKGVRGNAEANWDKFAKYLDTKTLLSAVNSKNFQAGVIYFFDHPPKKQIINDNGILGWKDEVIPENQQNFEKLLTLVRRARNNLFHGGKFQSGEVAGSDRDKKLIKLGLVILEECLNLDTVIEQEFHKEVFNIYED